MTFTRYNGKTICYRLLLIGLICPALLLAEGSGSFSGSFLRIGLGARALAMGNAQVASADNGYGGFYNPAALPNLDSRRFSASWSAMSLDRDFNFIGYAMPLAPFAGFSAGWINSGVGELRAYNSSGQDVGKVNHGLNAFYFSFGARIIALAQADKQLTNLPPDLINIGVTVKFLREGIDDGQDFNYDGSGFGADIGLMIRPVQSLVIGYQLKDINASLESNTGNIFERGAVTENNFPLTQKLGFSWLTPVSWLSAVYDFEWNDAGREEHHAGLEMTSKIAAGRIGYDEDRLTLGGGLRFNAFRSTYMMLDYAFLDSSVDEGVSHVFSWQFLF